MEKTINFLLETEKLKAVLRQTKPLGEDRFEILQNIFGKPHWSHLFYSQMRPITLIISK